MDGGPGIAPVTIPPPFDRLEQDIRELEAATLIVGLLRGCRRILNVGPSWGRDYYALTRAGHKVINLDVAVQAHLPQTVVADAGEPAPFAAGVFDAVVMAEVLEHIWHDVGALREAQRVLKPNGKLLVTVPFGSDEPEYHVRLHSARTIRRLLRSTGFDTIEFVERGGLISFPRLIHALRRLLHRVGRRDAFVRSVIRFDEWLGRRRFWGLRLSRYHGCIAVAVKAASVDFEHLNAAHFRH